MKKLAKILLIIFLLLIAVSGYFIYKYPFLNPGYHKKYSAEDYKNEISAIQNAKDTIHIKERKEWMVNMFNNNMVKYWLGTRWDFNGTTETPGEGKIACGYFVTTIIRDMGFDINRIKLAQCASEEMIKAVTDGKEIKRFNGKENELMMQYLQKSGKDLFIAGLDNHTGFILNDGKEIYFIHSSGQFPYCVIKQKIKDADVLLESQYKVIGCLSESDTIWKY